MSSERELLHRITEYLGRIADAQERIADADEQRNELLVKDAEARRDAWHQEIELRERQLRSLRRTP